MFAAAVPVASARRFSERVHQQDALERFARRDKPCHTIEIPSRLLLGVGRAAGRQRLEIRVAAAARMAGRAARVAFPRARENRLNPGFEHLVVQRRGRRRGWRLLSARRVGSDEGRDVRDWRLLSEHHRERK